MLTEPQGWTLIGVFATMVFALFASMSGYLARTMKSGFERVDAQIEGLRGEMNAKFDRVEDRLNYLDRDVQAIKRRVFPDLGDPSPDVVRP